MRFGTGPAQDFKWHPWKRTLRNLPPNLDCRGYAQRIAGHTPTWAVEGQLPRVLSLGKSRHVEGFSANPLNDQDFALGAADAHDARLGPRDAAHDIGHRWCPD